MNSSPFGRSLLKPARAFPLGGLRASRVSPRRATHFLLRRQEKVSKEKATRLSGSLRFAAGKLRCSIPAGGVRTRFAQTTAALDTASICAARPGQTGLRGAIGFGEAGTRKARPRRSPLANPIPSPPPVGLGRGAQPKTDQGERLSEPKASSSETPFSASTAGCPAAQRRGPRPSGRLFFGDFLLATQKKVTCRRATPGLLANRRPEPNVAAAIRLFLSIRANKC